MHLKTLVNRLIISFLLVTSSFISCNKPESTPRIKDYANSFGECPDCLKHNLEGYNAEKNIIPIHPHVQSQKNEKEILDKLTSITEYEVLTCYLNGEPHDSIFKIKKEYQEHLLGILSGTSQGKLISLIDSIGFLNEMIHQKEFMDIEKFKLHLDFKMLRDFVFSYWDNQYSGPSYMYHSISAQAIPIEYNNENKILSLGMSFGWNIKPEIKEIILDSVWYNENYIGIPEFSIVNNKFGLKFIRFSNLKTGTYRMKGRTGYIDLFDKPYQSKFEKSFKINPNCIE